jgi:glycine/D-amino acid oxidase-like deaminating enzyme
MDTSTAYHLPQKGCREVLLLEREAFFGQGSTGRCAGGFHHRFATEVDIRLSQHSMRMLEHFAQEMGQEIGCNQGGYLFLLSREEDAQAFRRNVELQHRLRTENMNSAQSDGVGRKPRSLSQLTISRRVSSRRRMTLAARPGGQS